MNTFRLLLAEMAYRPAACLLTLAAVAAAASLFLAGPTIVQGHAHDTRTRLAALEEESEATLKELDKKTKRIMRDIGVNLRIVHRDTDMTNLYANYKAVDFPETYVEKLANAPNIETIVHVVASIHQKHTWNGRTILLAGVLPVLTVSQKNEEKPHMVQQVERGEVFVGSELASGLKEGEQLEIDGRAFVIREILEPQGDISDAQLLLHLHDAQEVIGKPGRVHQILALSCKCKGDRLSAIRGELEAVLPDTRVTEDGKRATARELQRNLVVEKSRKQREMLKQDREATEQRLVRLLNAITPLVLGVAAIVVAAMAWLNVRQRRQEIGLLRALGKSSWSIAALFLGRSVTLGLAGGLCGAALGWLIARWIGAEILELGVDSVGAAPWGLAIATCIGAPVVSAIASYLPTLLAVAQDPAAALERG